MAKKVYVLQLVIIFIEVAFFSPVLVVACSCSEMFTPPCASFQRADLVFIGTVDSVSDSAPTSIDGFPYTFAHFTAVKFFKGETRKEVIVGFTEDNCDFKLEVNKRYFVYAHQGPSGKMMLRRCDRTRFLEEAEMDLDYVKSLSARQPKLFVTGAISSLSGDDLKDVRIIVTGKQGPVTSTITNRVFFNVNVDEPGNYLVRLVFPYKIKIFAPPGWDVFSPSETTIEYTVNLQKGHCEYREINFLRKEDPITVSGKFVNKTSFPAIELLSEALLIAVQTSKAQQWTQIKPLHSTRLEVERILGLPTERNNLTYNLPNERITIVYSDGALCREDWPFGWNVPADVVLSIYVYPKTKLSLADLNFDLKNFQKDEQPNGTLYRNEVDGIWIESEKFNSEIKSITLAGGSSDKALHCPAFAQREEKLKSGEYALLRPFLSYLVSSQDQKSYWNFFGASLLQALKKEPKTMGYAISYAGQSTCKDEASVRAEKVKQHLVSRFRIPSDNIVLIDGGYKQEPGIEFYIVPPGALKPLPSPQIHPSKITIAGDKNCSKVLLTQSSRATPGH